MMRGGGSRWRLCVAGGDALARHSAGPLRVGMSACIRGCTLFPSTRIGVEQCSIVASYVGWVLPALALLFVAVQDGRGEYEGLQVPRVQAAMHSRADRTR